MAAPSEKKQGRDTLDRSTLSQTGAGRRKKNGADVPWISQNKSGGRSHTLRYRTEDSADAGRGRSMNKIAGQLGLAEVTVKYHCRETYRKLGVNGKAAAVNEARKRKLI